MAFDVIEQRISAVVRVALLAIGLGLTLWALSDDYLIGGGPGFGFFQASVFVIGLSAIGAVFLPATIRASALAGYVSLFFGLAIVEVALGVFLSPRLVSIYELDSDYLYKFKPGARSEYMHLPENGGERHVYNINQNGFRGEEFRDPPGNPRIVIYGDSFVHAEFSTLENTYPKKLEASLVSAGYASTEVINAGVAGYGPDQILLRISDELALMQPDLLIISIFSGNDFGDLVRNKLFRLGSDHELVLNPFSFDPTIEFQATLAERELLLRKALRNIRDLLYKSLSEETVREDGIPDALRQHVQEYEEFVLLGNNLVHELRSDPYSADIALTPDSESAQYKIQLMEAVMSAIKFQADSQEIPIAFLLIPHPIDVVGGDHASGKIDIAEYPNYLPDRLTDELFAICTRQRLHCLNLMDEFRAKGGASLFLKGGDDHWNDHGQEVAAEATAQFVLSENLFPPDSGM